MAGWGFAAGWERNVELARSGRVESRGCAEETWLVGGCGLIIWGTAATGEGVIVAGREKRSDRSEERRGTSRVTSAGWAGAETRGWEGAGLV